MMSVDEALTLAEIVLEAEEEPLNDVQEIIFRECWQGRTSYEAIAHVSGYDKEYLKCAGAKLWQQLSEAFGEKVKKSNLKSVIRRYAQEHNLKPRNLVIEVNLSGASISGENISGENTLGHLSEAHFCVNDSQQKKTQRKIHHLSQNFATATFIHRRKSIVFQREPINGMGGSLTRNLR